MKVPGFVPGFSSEKGAEVTGFARDSVVKREWRYPALSRDLVVKR